MSGGIEDWYDSLGGPVSHEKRARAAEEAREMGLELDGEEMKTYIDKICKAIENDKPEKAIERTREKLDYTGAIRLLGFLCVEDTE